jgi:hypothetical protein
MSPTPATPPIVAELRRRLDHAEVWMRDANKRSAPNSRPNAEIALNAYFDLVEQIVAVSTVYGFINVEEWDAVSRLRSRRSPQAGSRSGKGSAS